MRAAERADGTGLIIFARMSSTRLPGKSLMRIGDRTLLGHVLARARRVSEEGVVVIATSVESSDDPIEVFGQDNDVPVFRGALEDVADRALACARAWGFHRSVRICGDRPFFPPEIVDTLLRRQEAESLDLACNTVEKTFPPGATVEVVATEALARVLQQTDDPADREHVTRYFYRHPERFRIGELRWHAPGDREVSLVVDTEEDLERARFIARRYPGDVVEAPLSAVIELARAWYAERSSSA